MELNKNIVYKNKYKILILIIVLSFFLLLNGYTAYLSKPNTEISQITIISNEKSQNKGETSYFLVLEPDNLGNLKIKAKVIDYNQNLSRIFSIIQNYPKSTRIGNNVIYQLPYPKLAYLFYSDKIFSLSSNTNVSYNFTENKITVNYSPENGFTEPRNSRQKIDLLLPAEIKKQNITNFSLLIFANDSNSESHLEIYPFDYIDTFVLFDFPNNSNVNLIVEIPKELNSYEINSRVFEEDKEKPDEKSPTPFKKIYS